MAQEFMKIEEARTQADEFVGLRISVLPGGQTLLVFADQAAMPGFRLGDAFVAGCGDTIIYRTAATMPIGA